MNSKEILKRITGISTPIFGISWNPDNTERDHAREVIAFLEDRRVLYNACEIEVPEHCIDSVVQIRVFLTERIGKIDQDSELSMSLRAMRAACRKYLDRMGVENDWMPFCSHRSFNNRWELHCFIGEMRGVFGIHIAKIAVTYGIDVESDLTSILPGLDSVHETKLNHSTDPSAKKAKRVRNIKR